MIENLKKCRIFSLLGRFLKATESIVQYLLHVKFSNFFEFIIHIIKTLFNNISVIENENTIIIKNIINIVSNERIYDKA